MVITRTRTCLTVDVEVFDTEWVAIGLLIAEYPSGKVLDHLETACTREEVCSRTKTCFWNRHHRAKLYIERLGHGQCNPFEEKRITNFVWKWLDAVPTLYLISDNPTFDLNILQDITTRVSPTRNILIRNGNYFQPVCTWSMKLALQMMYPEKRTTYKNRVSVPHCGIPHTPLYDCLNIMNHHFDVLDDIFDLQDRMYGGQPWK